jgi:hypothetical protein
MAEVRVVANTRAVELAGTKLLARYLAIAGHKDASFICIGTEFICAETVALNCMIAERSALL